MRYSSVAIIVKLIGDSIEECTGADLSVPCIMVHFELFEVTQIHHHCTTVTTQACRVSASSHSDNFANICLP